MPLPGRVHLYNLTWSLIRNLHRQNRISAIAAYPTYPPAGCVWAAQPSLCSALPSILDLEPLLSPCRWARWPSRSYLRWPRHRPLRCARPPVGTDADPPNGRSGRVWRRPTAGSFSAGLYRAAPWRLCSQVSSSSPDPCRSPRPDVCRGAARYWPGSRTGRIAPGSRRVRLRAICERTSLQQTCQDMCLWR